MPPRSAEEKSRRRLEAARKKEERETKKKKADEEEAAKQAADEARKTALQEAGGVIGGECIILDSLPEESFRQILACLPARELAAVSLTCQQWNYSIREARVPYLVDRLTSKMQLLDATNTSDDCRMLLSASYGGGETKRIVTKKQRKSTAARGDCDEFMAYARFLEEGVSGYSQLSTNNPNNVVYLPSHITNGRFCSASPEHSLVRVGGGDKSGAGGSGAASWGVGRRGQLGNGQRDDIAMPARLSGTTRFGYGVRVVQVSAGGGLVRVAHSLFLTAAGRVLSCGNGGYGQLGHGYSGAKQLPDYVRPKYIEAFQGMRMTCVSAGEIHSACVNSDGDLFTFGDGFLGMLGHGDKRPQVSPKQVERGGLEDECVATVACGCRHTLVVTEDAEVWSMGFGHFGVLGRSFTPYEYDAGSALENMGGGGDLEQDEGFVPLPVAPRPAVAALPVEEDPVLREEREREELRAHLDLLAKLTLDDPSDQCIPKVIDSLKGIPIVGASAGHRHSMLLDKLGGVYTCGSGVTGALGHGDTLSHMYPMKVMEFDNENVQIMQISAGVDMSMAVSTTGRVYSWGKSDGGRLGLGSLSSTVSIPRPVELRSAKGDVPIKAIDVECAFVHSLIVGLDGTLHQCGGVGIDGAADGQQGEENLDGKPVAIPDFNIWHRQIEPKEVVETKKWQKYGKYELQGRSKMMGHNISYGEDKSS